MYGSQKPEKGLISAGVTQWREIFLRFQSRGLPFKKFCELEKISANTFQYWRHELRSRDEALGISSISAGDNRPADLQEKIDYWLSADCQC